MCGEANRDKPPKDGGESDHWMDHILFGFRPGSIQLSLHIYIYLSLHFNSYPSLLLLATEKQADEGGLDPQGNDGKDQAKA
jgi:hypothetical protein